MLHLEEKEAFEKSVMARYVNIVPPIGYATWCGALHMRAR
jgi:hypothetical protein